MILISKCNWKKLVDLNLGKNNVENLGVQYLVRNNWSQLSTLGLWWSNINNIGIHMLLRANWN
jgi:hypothetical protein